MLNFPKAPAQYSETHQDQVQGALEREDKKTLKTDAVLNELKFRDTVTGTVVTVTVASGVLVVT